MDEKRKEAAGLGMILFIVVEAMFFLSLLFSYGVLLRINTASSPDELKNSAILMLCGNRGMQPTDGNYWFPDEIALPVEITGITTAILVISALTMFLSIRFFRNQQEDRGKLMLALTVIGGGIFLSVQGFEWYRLIAKGITGSEYLFGALFFLIIGAHALHVAGGLTGLLYCFGKALKGQYSASNLTSLTVSRSYWFFVVFLWPLLYWILYFP